MTGRITRSAWNWVRSLARSRPALGAPVVPPPLEPLGAQEVGGTLAIALRQALPRRLHDAQGSHGLFDDDGGEAAGFEGTGADLLGKRRRQFAIQLLDST